MISHQQTITNNQYKNNSNFNYANNTNQFNPNVNQIKKVQNYLFNLNDLIGRGNFSKVYKAINQITNQIVAIKVIELASIKNNALAQLLYSQIDVLKSLKHPNILNCLQIFTSANNCYIIAQFCNEGDMQSKIKQKGHFEQKQAKKIIYEVFLGLKYLNQQNIIHRDIKLANIFIKNGVIKIADFGFAKKALQPFKDINIGSPIYMSPQGILQNIYSPKSDIWAFGIFIYEILHGYTPLTFCKTQAELRHHILNPMVDEMIKYPISNQLKDIIFKCLEIDPKKRISIKQLQKHCYIQKLQKQLNSLTLNDELYGQNCMQSFFQNYNNSIKNIIKKQADKKILNFNNNSMDGLKKKNQENNNKNHKFNIRQNNFHNDNLSKHISKSPWFNNQHQQFSNIASTQGTDKKQFKKDNLEIIDQSIQKRFRNMKQRGLSVNRTTVALRPLKKIQFKSFPEELVYDTYKQKNTGKKRQNQNIEENDEKIISTVLSFQQCVQLLHYCRLLFKTINFMKRSEQNLNLKLIDYYSNWLLEVIKEIEHKIPYYAKFEGQKAILREQKLKQVINQYSSKYNRELKRKLGIKSNLKNIQVVTIKTLQYLESLINNHQNDEKQLINMFCYIATIYETNQVLEKCIKSKAYTYLQKYTNLQIFLANKKEITEVNTFIVMKQKIFNASQIF